MVGYRFFPPTISEYRKCPAAWLLNARNSHQCGFLHAGNIQQNVALSSSRARLPAVEKTAYTVMIKGSEEHGWIHEGTDGCPHVSFVLLVFARVGLVQHAYMHADIHVFVMHPDVHVENS